MAITNLQQARQLYDIGKRVGFRGGGMDASQDDFGSPSADTGNQSGNDAVDTGDLGTETANVQANIDANMSARERAIMNQYKNVPTPTITLGVDKFDRPIKVPTTYKAKRKRELTLDALNKKGISAFDPRVTKKFNPLDMSLVAQPTQKKFNFVRDFVVPAGLTLINPGLAAKYQKAKTVYNAAKFAAGLAETFGLTDKNVVDSFVSNLTDKTSSLGKRKTNVIDNTRDRDKDIFTGGGNGEGGLGTLENMDALNQEYLLLLEKFNKGVFTDADQVRFTFLQRILGR